MTAEEEPALQEQIRRQEEEAIAASQKPKPNPLAEEGLRSRIPRTPEQDAQEEKKRLESYHRMKMDDSRSKRGKIFQRSLGRRIRIHLRFKSGPKVEGILTDIDWEYATMIVENHNSPTKTFTVQMADIARFEVTDAEV